MKNSHPKESELQQFAHGELDDEHFEQIAVHLETCESCGDVLRKTGAFQKLDFQGQATEIHQPESETAGSVVGPYKLLQKLGEGGMGVVYMAEQEKPVRRVVALKIIKPGMDSGQVIARFEAERQALAMMDHHNIAKVLDAGTTDTGRPYFAMELVKGVPITEYCDRAKLTPRERLKMFVPVCHAIQHAHLKGVIHRDIKPSNVLVTLYDGRPVPMVIDFGVAKATQQKLTERTMFTGIGQILGTLEYMSPEQAELNQLDIDTRSDVYSLGVVLYELLTGSTPFTREELRAVGFEQMLRTLRDSEPPKPSTRLSESGDALFALSSVRQTEPKKLSRLMRGDLDWIVMKALEKDRTRRYETANALAADVERFLANDTVEACPPSTRYRVRKFVQRNKQLALSAAIVCGILVAATVVSFWFGIWAIRNEQIVSDKVVELQEKSASLIEAERDTQEALDASIQSQKVAEQKSQEASKALLDSLIDQMKNERLARQPGYRQRVFQMVQQAKSMTDDPEFLALIRQRTIDCLGDFVGFDPVCVQFDLTENDRITRHTLGRFMAIGTAKGYVQLADANSGAILTHKKVFDEPVDEIWFTSDGRLGCCANLFSTPEVVVFEVSGSGTLARSARPNAEEPISLRFVRKHGSMVAARHRYVGPIFFLDEDTLLGVSETHRDVIQMVKGNGDIANETDVGMEAILDLSADRHGNYLFVGGNSGYKLFSIQGHQLQQKFYSRVWSSFGTVSPNGRLAVSDSNNGLMLRSLESNAILAELPSTGQSRPKFSEDSRSLYAARSDASVEIWQLHDRTPERIMLEGHVGGVPTVVFDAGRDLMLSCGKDATVCIWDKNGNLLCRAEGFEAAVLQSVGVDSTSRFVATTCWDPAMVELFSIEEALSRVDDSLSVDVTTLPSHQQLKTRDRIQVYDAQFSDDGKLLAVGGQQGVSIWERRFDDSVERHIFSRRSEASNDAFRPHFFRTKFIPGTSYVALATCYLKGSRSWMP